jgi:hypothetical protein
MGVVDPLAGKDAIERPLDGPLAEPSAATSSSLAPKRRDALRLRHFYLVDRSGAAGTLVSWPEAPPARMAGRYRFAVSCLDEQ